MFGPKSGARHYFWLTILLICLALSLSGCGAKKSKYPLSGKSYTINGQYYHVLAAADGYVEKGQASWYGRKFHGRKTASGEVYDMYKMTAAHKTLPLQTWVAVTNLKNGREITVKINDRGPFVRGRVIDLSYTAAKKLDLVGPGTAPVRIAALGRAENRKENGRVKKILIQPSDYRQGRFTVQVGSFRDREKAQALAGRLRRQYGSSGVQPYDRGDAVFYRVHVSDKRNLSQASKLQAQLEKRGFHDCFVVAR